MTAVTGNPLLTLPGFRSVSTTMPQRTRHKRHVGALDLRHCCPPTDTAIHTNSGELHRPLTRAMERCR